MQSAPRADVPFPPERAAAPLAFAPEVPEVLTALLVTDLVAFTPLLARMGDLDARSLIRAHNRAVRECLRQHAGLEITHLGDGVMAAFRSVRGALGCAIAIQRALARHTRLHPAQPLRARIGVHAGEPVAEDGRLFGICVNTAVRICDAAAADCVLVSDVVRQLALGQRLQFEDRGAFALQGIAEPVRLHELVWTAAPEPTHARLVPADRLERA